MYEVKTISTTATKDGQATVLKVGTFFTTEGEEGEQEIGNDIWLACPRRGSTFISMFFDSQLEHIKSKREDDLNIQWLPSLEREKFPGVGSRQKQAQRAFCRAVIQHGGDTQSVREATGIQSGIEGTDADATTITVGTASTGADGEKRKRKRGNSTEIGEENEDEDANAAGNDKKRKRKSGEETEGGDVTTGGNPTKKQRMEKAKEGSPLGEHGSEVRHRYSEKSLEWLLSFLDDYKKIVAKH